MDIGRISIVETRGAMLPPSRKRFLLRYGYGGQAGGTSRAPIALPRQPVLSAANQSQSDLIKPSFSTADGRKWTQIFEIEEPIRLVTSAATGLRSRSIKPNQTFRATGWSWSAAALCRFGSQARWKAPGGWRTPGRFAKPLKAELVKVASRCGLTAVKASQGESR